MRLLLCLAILLIFAVRTNASSKKDDLPEYLCPKISTPVRVDGNLTDEAWKHAPEMHLKLYNGKEPVAKTTAKMCWNDKCLYICFDSEDQDIWGTMTNRDDPIYREEVVEFFFNPSGDLTNYFELNLSPRNTIFDTTIVNTNGHTVDSHNAAWNIKWLRTAVKIDGTLDNREDIDRRWTAEIAIPFTSIPGLKSYPPKVGDTWRVNLYRINLTPVSEFCCWSPTLGDFPNFHIPGRFGTLRFGE